MFSISQTDDPAIWTLSGRLDNSTCAEIDQKAAELARGGTVVLDMSGVDYVSSAGLRAILQLLKRFQSAGGRLHLAALQPPVREIFEISGFKSIVPIFPSVADAKP
ncbi:MAG: STAS domain-containing protein [Terrimicrobiaceae bacterium]|nr:STAS domain-containing protein [Terrimicrobiaceae bacterium]